MAKTKKLDEMTENVLEINDFKRNIYKGKKD